MAAVSARWCSNDVWKLTRRGRVVPERHDEDRTGLESVAHCRKSAEGLEGVRVAELGLLGVAEVVRDRVRVRTAGKVGGDRVLDHDAILDV